MKQPVDFVVQAAVFFLLIFFFSIVFFYVRVALSLINKIKKIYDDIYTTTGKNIYTNNESEVAILNESLKMLASDRK